MGGVMAKKKLNIGMVGYGFMGRTHSNAFAQAPHFFDLGYQPVLKTICARNAEKAEAFAQQWGYEGSVTDWRKLIDDKSISGVTELLVKVEAANQDPDVKSTYYRCGIHFF